MIASTFFTRSSRPRRLDVRSISYGGPAWHPLNIAVHHFAAFCREQLAMRAIILAAGQGSRLLPLTADRPKCLIDFSGRSLLDWQLEMLGRNGIDDVLVVTGFREDQIEAALARRGRSPRVTTLFNPFYKVADNLGTLWMARDWLQGDCLTLNGDTLVSEALVARALSAGLQGIAVTVDRKDAYDADDMKVVRADDGRLLAIGKRLDEGVNAESIGLIVYRGDGAARFRGEIERVMRTAEGTNVWYLRVVHQLAQRERVETLDISGEAWGEVDFPEDLDRARALTAGWA
jgi:choline kinase